MATHRSISSNRLTSLPAGIFDSVPAAGNMYGARGPNMRHALVCAECLLHVMMYAGACASTCGRAACGLATHCRVPSAPLAASPPPAPHLAPPVPVELPCRNGTGRRQRAHPAARGPTMRAAGARRRARLAVRGRHRPRSARSLRAHALRVRPARRAGRAPGCACRRDAPSWVSRSQAVPVSRALDSVFTRPG